MAGLYFHIPFCKRVCAYCDFYKSVDLRCMDPLLESMHRELDARREYLGGEPVRTRYFGGGTPSLCAPEAIAGLLDHAATLFDCTAAEETTLEANPDDLTPAYLAALRRAGVNRLSVGIQSFDDACLKLMNRRHNAAQAVEAVRSAQREGYENITVDLIFGVPGFGNDTLRRSLDSALALGVQHISAYHLTVEPGTAFGRRAARGQFAPVDEATSETEYALVHETLTGAGFEHYEVSNFALPGFRPPQRGLLARREVPRHRPRSPFVRRPGTPLERRLGDGVHRRRARRSGNPHRPRPLQRIRDDPAAHGRRHRPAGGGKAVRQGARGTGPARCGTVAEEPHARSRSGTDGRPAGSDAGLRRGDRNVFRNGTGHRNQVKLKC